MASVVKWSQRQRATGSAVAIPMGGHRKRLLEPHRALVIERLKAVPDLTLKTLVAGARLLFLPPCSPDLNALLSEVEGPIEQMFAKLKLLLRKAAERTVEATSQRIGSLLNTFPPHECANYLRNSGYGAA